MQLQISIYMQTAISHTSRLRSDRLQPHLSSVHATSHSLIHDFVHVWTEEACRWVFFFCLPINENAVNSFLHSVLMQVTDQSCRQIFLAGKWIADDEIAIRNATSTLLKSENLQLRKYSDVGCLPNIHASKSLFSAYKQPLCECSCWHVKRSRRI